MSSAVSASSATSAATLALSVRRGAHEVCYRFGQSTFGTAADPKALERINARLASASAGGGL